MQAVQADDNAFDKQPLMLLLVLQDRKGKILVG